MQSAPTATNDVVVALRPEPAAVGAARRTLVQKGLDDDLTHTVCLLASEAVTNSIRHAGLKETDRIVLAARMAPEFVRVEVRDPGNGFDPEIRHQASGYGLRMLEMLASRWGVDRHESGCRVWFEIDRRRRRFDRNPARSR
ncbi:MAG TPA: ATP-binding protein [Solirubrobacteraceae bacterium]